MNFKKCLFAFSLSLWCFCANAETIQSQIRSEYGNCYQSLAQNLNSCKASNCTYPDLTDSKEWKAINIVGKANEECYVMYYSYVGQKITSEPDHCFYNNKQQTELAKLYAKLFRSTSSFEITEIKDRISYLGASNCKKNEQNKKQDK